MAAGRHRLSNVAPSSTPGVRIGSDPSSVSQERSSTAERAPVGRRTTEGPRPTGVGCFVRQPDRHAYKIPCSRARDDLPVTARRNLSGGRQRAVSRKKDEFHAIGTVLPNLVFVGDLQGERSVLRACRSQETLRDLRVCSADWYTSNRNLPEGNVRSTTLRLSELRQNLRQSNSRALPLDAWGNLVRSRSRTNVPSSWPVADLC